MSGVYAIRCIPTRKIYVGSTKATISRRFTQHKSALRRGDAKSHKLQHAWNKYGEEAFELVRLVDCAPECARDLEQLMLDALKPELNIMALVHGGPVAHTGTQAFKVAAAERARRAWANGVFADRQRHPRDFHTINGEQFSVRQICTKYSLKAVTVRERLRKGLTGVALVQPPGFMYRRFKVHGKMLTVRELATVYGLNRNTVLYRIRAGVRGDALARASRQGAARDIERTS